METILRALHLSSLEDDAANEQKRGTPGFDRLQKVKPLYTEIQEACRRNYHPRQKISIDERMVASKARVGFKQYMKGKPVQWGYKLFVLADSCNGFTWDFFIYQGKTDKSNEKGPTYNTVTTLMDTKRLGTGYKVFVDNFYTSPVLFSDLLKQKMWACGTIRSNRIGFPKTTVNALDSKSQRGSMRWICEGSLLFVQWRDTKDVSLCSTIHTAHGDDTVSRKMKDDDGNWTVSDVPVPPAVKDYNRYSAVYLTKFCFSCKITYFSIFLYVMCHYLGAWEEWMFLTLSLATTRSSTRPTSGIKHFFYHFINIAVVNAFLLHKELFKAKGEPAMSQKAFRETLVERLFFCS